MLIFVLLIDQRRFNEGHGGNDKNNDGGGFMDSRFRDATDSDGRSRCGDDDR